MTDIKIKARGLQRYMHDFGMNNNIVMITVPSNYPDELSYYSPLEVDLIINELLEEIEDLKHDISEYVNISSELAEEITQKDKVIKAAKIWRDKTFVRDGAGTITKSTAALLKALLTLEDQENGC